MLPEIAQLEFHTETKAAEDFGKSFLFDFQQGDFVLRDGRLIKTDGIEALKVWIMKVLKTERGKFKIYEDTDYGTGLEDLIGQTLPRDFVESELKREIRTALEKHPMIKSISNLNLSIDGEKVMIEFTVNLVQGNTFGQEVIF
ncbi:DUF2634 domain-containing protein [Geosporobacter ferrireducens]|uniref:DUF2634 domain-containing protein n=1 Tax=Geosporobacter ferrireducens TaxID=1424294 RepID=A0A1D8GIH4_9FIRM|nr:DUF2634 domain-containing protein [Geosporobacter ferrireducens]AOT70691.1 hypothetical protein Gferi_14580 [Geosporobacter ferrireducens]MTI57492.1 DUF2634 domain-containing protein [Geosporobacter ferrireducens]